MSEPGWRAVHRSIIPVDLRNPGQVFACLGFAETVEQIYGDYCEVEFAYRGREAATSFILSCERRSEPIARVLEFLREAAVSTVVPVAEAARSKDLSTKKWGIPETDGEPGFLPSPLPSSPATLPVLFRGKDERELILSSWADGPASGRDNVKFWGGSGGNPASAIAIEMLKPIRDLPASDFEALTEDPFSFSRPMTSSFRFDWRRDYIPLDAGFSPNSHGNVSMVGYPLTEILAAIGLQHARPQRINPRDKLKYRYAVTNARMPLIFARPILGAADLGFALRTFLMTLGWPGQAGQSRCIVDAYEEI